MELMERKRPYRYGTAQRVLLICLGVVLLCAAVFLALIAGSRDGGGQISGGMNRFDSYEDSGKEEYLDFVMLSDSFATFTYGERHGIFTVFDPDGYAYLVCLPSDAPETYAEIYTYTYSDSQTVPSPARITGYAMEIDSDLRDLAIDYLNEVYYGEGFLTTENFSDYLGDYYLDTTYRPQGSGASLWALLAAILCGAAGAALLVVQRRRAPAVESAGTETGPAGEGLPGVETMSAADRPTDPWELEQSPKLQRGAGILGAVFGALAGAAIWVGMYQLGYLVGIASMVGVILALKLYEKFAGGLDTFGVVISAVVALAAMVAANVAAYALAIFLAVRESTTPGRADFFYILRNFGPLMESADAWGDFAADLAIGLLLGIVAAAGSIVQAFQRARQGKKRDGQP